MPEVIYLLLEGFLGDGVFGDVEEGGGGVVLEFVVEFLLLVAEGLVLGADVAAESAGGDDFLVLLVS